ncbi:MAG: polysulfide reductase NrfD [Bacteroidales bacterium]|nr:polysulfide reductase NrfD [Bacteroidales bacterium]
MNKSISQNNIIKSLVEKPSFKWWIAFVASLVLICWGIYCMWQTTKFGIGKWGLNNTVGWGMAITNFVWWIGIGHAGTFISAILLLFRQKWRITINRAAETMTILAIVCAAVFPLIHMGRIALFFYTFPYPNARNLWVNFNSPLLWDVFAISTYLIVSFLFWYLGLIPDFALLKRLRLSKWKSKLYAFLSKNWTGSVRQWKQYHQLIFFIACLATPLVISVHSIVSMDFATSVIPGWHSSIFPPYFVAGAIFSGFAMVQLLVILSRKVLALNDYISVNHVESMNKIILAMGSMVGMAYLIEVFIAFYSGNEYEIHLLKQRVSGNYSLLFLAMWIFNFLLPQLLWIKKLRRNFAFTIVLSLCISFGMWAERFVIVVTSLQQDYLPSAWTIYKPTITEYGIFAGTIGIFCGMYLLIMRFIPIISPSELNLHKEFNKIDE